MTQLSNIARSILRQAALSEFGLEIGITATSDKIITPALRAKQILYRFKSEDADFSNLRIDLSPTDPDKYLWIINTGPRIPTTALEIDL